MPSDVRGSPLTGNRLRAAAGALAGTLVASALLAGCSEGSGTDRSAAPEPKDLVIFVFDRSRSIPDHQLRQARELTDGRISELEHGDRVAALEVLMQSLEEEPKRWSQPVPERRFPDRELRRDSVSLARFQADARVFLRSYSDTADRSRILHTDLLSTMHNVASEIRAFPDHRPILYIFSDMLQSDGTFEMEGLRRMPSEGWVRRRAAEGRLPNLEGVCVNVVGARTDTRTGQRVKRFWTEYVEATGAKLFDRNYTFRPVRLPTRPCRPGSG